MNDQEKAIQRYIWDEGDVVVLNAGEKHLAGQHNQKLHGRWATGGARPLLADTTLIRAIDDSETNDIAPGTGRTYTDHYRSQLSEAGSIKDVEELVRMRYPDKFVLFGGADHRVMREQMITYDELAEAFPRINKRIGSLETNTDLESNWYARASPPESFFQKDGSIKTTLGRMEFNTKYYGDGEILSRAVSADHSNKFHPRQAWRDESVLVHEFGHHVLFDMTQDRRSFLPHVSAQGFGHVTETTYQFVASNSATAKLSKYATANWQEGFAEGFVNYWYDKQPGATKATLTPYERNQTALINHLYNPKTKFYAEGEWTDIPTAMRSGKLTPDTIQKYLDSNAKLAKTFGIPPGRVN